MAGFFRDLATRALAPRSAMHPISAAPYSGSEGAAPADSAVWPQATRESASRDAARTPDGAGTTITQTRLVIERLAAPNETAHTTSPLAPQLPPARESGAGEPARAAADRPQARAAARNLEHPDETERTPPHAARAATPLRPTPLRPAPLRPASPARPHAPLRIDSRVDADTQPAPEVHIHIGRIELTAAPTQVEKPRKPATRKAMSLDEYLQQRSRR